MKKKYLKFSMLSAVSIFASTSLILSCNSKDSQTKKTFFASRSVAVDQLITLGIAPKWIHKTKQGQKIENYLKPYVEEEKMENIDDQKPWSQTVDKEKIASLDLKGAFISNFQWKLYKNLKESGLIKNQIGFTTMGETYFPDLDYKISEYINKKRSFNDVMTDWNSKYPKNLIRATSEDLSSEENVIKMIDNDNVNDFINDKSSNKDENGNWLKGNGGFKFKYSYDFGSSFKVLAENLDRILNDKAIINNKTALERAQEIIKATKKRISIIRKIANLQSKSIIALKPNYQASSIDDIIAPKFAWDPTIFSFLYSKTNGMGMKMPNYSSEKTKIEYLEGDVDGLKANDQQSVLDTFRGQSDYVIFLRPTKFNFSDDEIKQKIKEIQKTSNKKNVLIVPEDLWYQGNFGILGTNIILDEFIKKFKLEVSDQQKQWGWIPFSEETVKIYSE